MPRVVDRQQRFCARRNRCRHAFWIDVQGIFTDVNENRLTALIKYAVRGCRKRQWRRDRLISDSKSSGKSGAMQRCRPAAETHGITSAIPRRECFLKLT